MKSNNSYLNDNMQYLQARVEVLTTENEKLREQVRVLSSSEQNSNTKTVHHLNDTFKKFVQQVFVQPLADIHTDKYKKS